jgi:hypothetical protein
MCVNLNKDTKDVLLTLVLYSRNVDNTKIKDITLQKVVKYLKDN